MKEDSEMLDEVVVTALGIKREKKMLGYAVQELKSDELNKTGDPSVTSALQGKVAGLSMNTSATGLGGSTKITIRGNSSLSDNNQPLWIVDVFRSAITTVQMLLFIVVLTVVALLWISIPMILKVFQY